MIPAVLTLCTFLTGDIEGTNSSNILCLVFVYVLCKFVSGLNLLLLDNLWFYDSCAE